MADIKKKKRPWFRSNKKQYKKMVLAVYPAQQEEGIVQTNLSKLAFYATTTPSELEPIGAFIEKRIREDLVKRRLGWVEVGARALNELTKSCHTDLHLFGSHVMVVIRLLLEDERVELNVLAVDIFRRFAEYQDEVSQFDLDKFVPYFERMAAPGRAGTDGARLRTAGLEALDAYVQRVADPDAFVLRRIDAPPGPPTPLVSAVLSAITHAQKEKGDDKAFDAANSCLRDLGQRANHLTTRILVSAVLAYIDTQKLWGTPQAPETLKTLCLAIPPQFDHLTSSALLQHLDASPLSMRASIVNCITAVMRSAISSMVELVHSLLRHLQQPEAAPADQPAEAALHEAIVGCITTASKRVADPTQRLDAIAHVLDKFPQCTSALSRRSFAAVLSSLCDSLERERPRAVSQAVMSSCVALLAHKDEEVRRAALALVLQLLSLVLQGPANTPASPAAVVRPTANFSPDMLLGTAGDLLRSGLYHHAQMAGNTPRSYVLISRVFALLLKSLGTSELVLSFPLVFRLQSRLSKSVKKDSDKATITLALWAHALVAAYLLCAAKLFASRELEEHVKTVLKKRKGLTGRLKVEEEGVLSAPESASEASVLTVLEGSALFNREACIDALGRTSALQAHAEQRAALAAKYRSKSVKARAQPSDRKAARDLLAPLMRAPTANNALQLSRRASMRPSTASLRGAPHERRADAGGVSVAQLRRAGGAQLADDEPLTLSPRTPGRPLSMSASSPTVASVIPATLSFAESLRSAQAAQDGLVTAARLISGAMEVAPQASRYSVLAEGVALPTLQLAY